MFDEEYEEMIGQEGNCRKVVARKMKDSAFENCKQKLQSFSVTFS